MHHHATARAGVIGVNAEPQRVGSIKAKVVVIPAAFGKDLATNTGKLLDVLTDGLRRGKVKRSVLDAEDLAGRQQVLVDRRVKARAEPHAPHGREFRHCPVR